MTIGLPSRRHNIPPGIHVAFCRPVQGWKEVSSLSDLQQVRWSLETRGLDHHELTSRLIQRKTDEVQLNMPSRLQPTHLNSFPITSSRQVHGSLLSRLISWSAGTTKAPVGFHGAPKE